MASFSIAFTDADGKKHLCPGPDGNGVWEAPTAHEAIARVGRAIQSDASGFTLRHPNALFEASELFGV